MEGTLGQILMFGGTFAPRDWTFCAGQFVPIQTNTALFSILGITFGGNGQTNFAIPDFRGRYPMGYGYGPGNSPRNFGEMFGQETHYLSTNNIPSHTHTATFTPVGGGVTGKLEAYAKGASSGTPTAGDFISGDTSTIFGTGGGIGNELVELGGLSVDGGNVNGEVTVNPAGAGTGFNSFDPTLVVAFVINENGAYPSRN